MRTFGQWLESFDMVQQFVQDFRLYLQHEPEALANDRERYLQWVEEPMVDRLAKSGLSLDDPETFYKMGNDPRSPIRNGMILAGMYYRTIKKDIWQREPVKKPRKRR